jgi:ankyrin repeat protein
MKTFRGSMLHCGVSLRAAGTLLLAALAWSSPAFCGPIHDAARDGDLKKVETLIKEHPDLVASNDEKYGQTPLHVAAFNDRMDVAKLLLANKADINAKAKNGSTPLHLAAAKGNKDIVELLLANKADVNAVDNDGWSPMHSAVVWDHKDVQDFLSQNGGKELPAPRPPIKAPSIQGAAANTAKPASTPVTSKTPPSDKTVPATQIAPSNQAAPAGKTASK